MTRSTYRLPLLLLPLLLLLGLGDAQAQRKVAAKAKKATATKVRSTRSSKAKSSAAKSSRTRKATTTLIKGKSGAKTKTTSLKAASAKSKTTAKNSSKSSATKKSATKSLAKSTKKSSAKKGSTAAKNGKSAKSSEAQKRASGSTGGKKTASSSGKKSSTKTSSKKSDAEIREARKAAASKGKGKSKGTTKTRTASSSKSKSSTRSSTKKSTASTSSSRSSSKTTAKTTTPAKGKKLTQAQREGLAAERVANGGEVLRTTPFNGDIRNPITGLGPVEVVVRHGAKSKGPLTFMQRIGRFFSPSYERKYMVMVNPDGSTMKLSSRPNAPFFRAFHGLMNALPLRELAHDVLHSKGVREGIFTAALGGAATTVTPVGSVGIYRGAQQMIEGVKRRRDARNQVFDKTMAWAKSQGKKGNYPNLANTYRHYKMELQRTKPGTHPATLRNFAEQLAANGL